MCILYKEMANSINIIDIYDMQKYITNRKYIISKMVYNLANERKERIMLTEKRVHELKVFAEEIRVETLKIIHSRGFGHVGGSMSLADAMAVLYGEVMNVRPEEPRWEDRDWFVLSKGHAAPVLYATLAHKGYFDREELKGLRKINRMLQGHPDMKGTPGVEMSTGSLGQGFSVVVTKIEGDSAYKRRIMDMGITKGSELYIRKVAPLGDPVEITVRGYELSVRKDDAQCVQVK